MKKYFFLFTLLLALAVAVAYASTAGQMAGSVPVSGVTPSASYALDAAGGSGSQLYESVSATWEGGGADAVTFSDGFLVNTAATGPYINSTRLFGLTDMTITFDYQVSNVSSGSGSVLKFGNAASNDYLSYLHYAASGNSGMNARFGGVYYQSIRWSNAGLAANTTISVILQFDFTNNVFKVFVNGAEKTLTNGSSDISAISPWSAMANPAYIAISNDTDTTRIKNLKIYNAVVGP